MATSTGTGQFSVQNGQIIGPDGKVFIAHGVDIPLQLDVDTLLSQFPGLNFVRLPSGPDVDPASMKALVDSLTAKGVVVEIEDHSSSDSQNRGGGTGTIFSGDALNTEMNWYSTLASMFKDNPYVWFGTNNEPSEINPATGQTDAAALSAWQGQTYDTIRATGNTNPVMMEMNSWGPGTDKTGVGYDASVYAGETNIIWDPHFYGWLSNYSTDQATVTSTLQGIIQATQTFTSADGTVPVIIGEYGNSTTGADIDANGNQVISAVLGSAAWDYNAGNPGDGLLNNDGSLSSYGQMVAQGIAAASGDGTAPLPGFSGTDGSGVTTGIATGTGSSSGSLTGGSSGTAAGSTNPVTSAGAAGTGTGGSSGGGITMSEGGLSAAGSPASGAGSGLATSTNPVTGTSTTGTHTSIGTASSSGGLVTSTNPVTGTSTTGTHTSTGTGATPATPTATAGDPTIASLAALVQSLEATVQSLMQQLSQAMAAMTGTGAPAITTNTTAGAGTGGALAGATTGHAHHHRHH